jgi:hypothetical protein
VMALCPFDPSAPPPRSITATASPDPLATATANAFEPMISLSSMRRGR